MPLDVVWRHAEVQGEPIEEHHRDIDARGARSSNARAQPLKIGLVEPSKVELRLAVGGCAGTSARPGLRRRTEVGDAAREIRLEVLPAPEPDEVVPVLRKEGEVGAKVEPVGWIGAGRTKAHAVVEVVLEVRASQIHDAVIGAGWIGG